MRAVRDDASRAGKSRPALPGSRTALREMRTETTLLQFKSRLFGQFERSEHSDSEFYYPDDLSATELLQQPTSFESEEKRLKLLTDEEAHNFITFYLFCLST